MLDGKWIFIFIFFLGFLGIKSRVKGNVGSLFGLGFFFV